ncbi:hypothetical protein GCM10022198_18210 [Klugiella xanthotipulae]|uniref:Lipoprotein n=1 Tax=Klugiella xanthotipulae TaxID=244735 RepID=A0A543HRX8_9MICO|nr:hypothetical protein [Klugiella xanthotipulae]TQM61024.1 hypothetical protein FB466_1951 [Klugiella xanthotipulae]
MRLRHIGRAALVLGLAGLLSGGVSGCLGNTSESDAAAAVTEFFDRLGEGDAEGAVALFDDELVDPVACPALLTNAAYETVRDRPVNVRIRGVEDEGSGYFSVSVSYQLGKGGDTVSDTVDVVQNREHADRWEINYRFIGEHFVTISPRSIFLEDRLTVQGVCSLTASTHALEAFPGTYTVKYTDALKLGAPESFDLALRAEFDYTDRSSVPDPELSAGGREEILGFLQRSAEQCVSDLLVGPTCPPWMDWQEDELPLSAALIGDPLLGLDSPNYSDHRWVVAANGETGKVFSYTYESAGSVRTREVSAGYYGALARDADGELTFVDWLAD